MICQQHRNVNVSGFCPICLIDERDKLKKALEEITAIQPIVCDGNHQGDYACDLQKEIAEEALS